VADTWNRRVQVFTLAGDFLRAWPVAGWGSQSLVNKPYLAVDNAGRVYVSDPEGGRLIVFDAAGTPLAMLDLGGMGAQVSPLPTGVHVDAQDRIWVSDAANHRLLRFSPLSDFQPDERGHP
jgi:sugar lactone lactonase YvrE